jgi:hypothetical protein
MPHIDNQLEAFLLKCLIGKDDQGITKLLKELSQNNVMHESSGSEKAANLDLKFNQKQTDGHQNLKFMLNQKREEYLREI